MIGYKVIVGDVYYQHNLKIGQKVKIVSERLPDEFNDCSSYLVISEKGLYRVHPNDLGDLNIKKEKVHYKKSNLSFNK